MGQQKSSLRVAFLTHEPFYPPSGGGSAEALYLVQEMVRRGHTVHVFCPQVDDPAGVAAKFNITLHPFTLWSMGRYARLRNVKYLFYPFFLERLVTQAARPERYDLIFSQHAISAVAAGRLKSRLNTTVVMNFPDFLTGFMETWPVWLAPPPLLALLKRYELKMPVRYGVDAVCAISDTQADLFVERGYPRERILPIYYGYAAEHFPFQERTPDPSRPAIVAMHGSLDFHHIGEIAFGAIREVTRARPGTVFRFVGQRTPALETLLRRAGREISGFRFEATGFVPYAEVARHLADASAGMVPYEESSGTHCAFVAKVVENVAIGLPCVCTPLKSIQRYFKTDPMVRFAEFDGAAFGRAILSRLDESPSQWRPRARESARRVREELDWQPLCRKAIDFAETAARGHRQQRE